MASILGRVGMHYSIVVCSCKSCSSMRLVESFMTRSSGKQDVRCPSLSSWSFATSGQPARGGTSVPLTLSLPLPRQGTNWALAELGAHCSTPVHA